MPYATLRPLGVLAVIALLACSGDSTSPPEEKDPPVATTLTKVSGDSQSVSVGKALPDPLVVNVKDQYGSGLSGVSVSWEVTGGGGALAASTSTTGSTGNASVEWTVGTAAGENSARASVTGIAATVNFSATGMPGEVTSLAVSRESLSFAALEDTAHVGVAAADEYGNEVPGSSIAWSSLDASVASVAGGVVTANGNGSTSVVAAAGGLSDTVAVTVEQIATAVAISAGNDQTGPAGEELPTALTVNAADANGFGVGGVPVLWAPGATSGSVSADSLDTDAAGDGAVSWTLGLHSGTDTVVATVRGFEQSPLTFTATATPNGVISGTIRYTSVLQDVSQGATPVLESRSSDGSLFSMSGLTRDGSREVRAHTTRLPRQDPQYVPGSLIITYRADALAAPQIGSLAYRSAATARSVVGQIRAELAAHTAVQDFEVRGVSPAILAARIKVPPERTDAVRRALERDPRIVAVEPEALVYWLGRTAAPTGTIPNDPYYRPQAWHYNRIGLPEAWDITTGSSSVLVAVVDDGIRFDHPAISANLTSDGYDFVTNVEMDICGVVTGIAGDGDDYDPDPTVPLKVNTSTCDYGEAHGLHVAGTIGAAGNDGVGVTGVSWSVRLRPIRVLGINGTGSNYDVAQGILYAAGLPADNGVGGTVQAPSRADVINLSLGGPSGSTDLENAVASAAQAGALIIAGAGNDSVSTPYYPAAYPEVVSVSAVGPEWWELASYSNFGSTIDIAAPGGEGVVGSNHGVLSTAWDFSTGTPYYEFFQGTSMAAPHVSGVAALLLAQEPGLTAAQLRSRLLDYAEDLGPAGWDDQFGWGLVNARNSLTATHAPPRDLYVRLYDATSGSILTAIPAETDNTYTFFALEDGDYYVFAGLDREGDRLAGWPGRMWGAFGSGTASPAALTVFGAGTQDASFSVGWPSESEPNDTWAEADQIVLDGHLRGNFSTTTDTDVYRVTLPAGQYTFETSGWTGACWYALESDTALELYNDSGQILTSNNDIDAGALNYCSRITASLAAGTYEVRVLHVDGGGIYRLHQLHVREGT